MNYNPIRGTNEYLPSVAKVREIVRQRILSSYILYLQTH